MKILEYEYDGPNWKFHQVRFQKINLIVGDSGTGKTRLLNTLFNIGTYVAQGKLSGGEDKWNLSLEVDKDIYKWNVTKHKKDERVVVEKEQLFLNDELILARENNEFRFRDQHLPNLASNELSLSILREEKLIKPLYDGFSKILRRNFFEDALGMNSSIVAISQKWLDKIGEKKDLNELYKVDLALNPRLYVLSKYFPTIYEEIITHYRETFNFISDVKLRDSSDLDSLNIPGGVPILCIKEQSVGKWLPLNELSSGMQKVLLILVDLLSLPKGGIYLIDEYENSLGVGAIDFLPNFLFSRDFDFQILLTSHHPYIISNIPVEYWYVAHRKGSQVNFVYGEELVKRYSVSSQEKYLQLLNDSFYSEGIE